jgi:hypothetical protein
MRLKRANRKSQESVDGGFPGVTSKRRRNRTHKKNFASDACARWR